MPQQGIKPWSLALQASVILLDHQDTWLLSYSPLQGQKTRISTSDITLATICNIGLNSWQLAMWKNCASMGNRAPVSGIPGEWSYHWTIKTPGRHHMGTTWTFPTFCGISISSSRWINEVVIRKKLNSMVDLLFGLVLCSYSETEICGLRCCSSGISVFSSRWMMYSSGMKFSMSVELVSSCVSRS